MSRKYCTVRVCYVCDSGYPGMNLVREVGQGGAPEAAQALMELLPTDEVGHCGV